MPRKKYILVTLDDDTEHADALALAKRIDEDKAINVEFLGLITTAAPAEDDGFGNIIARPRNWR